MVHKRRSQRLPLYSGQGAADPPPHISSAVLFRLDAHPVIDCVAELLFASEVALRGLDGDVSKQELDLIQLAAGHVAEPRASASQVVRRELLNSCTRGGFADGDYPVLLADLNGFDVKAEQLAAAKPASDPHGEDRVVPFATQ